jgi:hypothetical protein
VVAETFSVSKRLRIWSYFSLATDLAREMRDWPEFVRGQGYDVELLSRTTGEEVQVRYVESADDVHVVITSSGNGPLFDRVAGRVIYALSAHTDHLTIDRQVHAGLRQRA